MRDAGLLLAGALILGDLGPHEAPLESLGIVAGLLVWALAEESGRWRRGMALLAGLPALLHLDSIEGRLAVLVVLTACGPAPARAAETAFAAATLAWRLLLTQVPFVWMVFVELSRLLSAAAGRIGGRPLDLGPSASGLDLLVLFGLHAMAWRLGGRRLLPIRAAGWIAALCLYIGALPLLAAFPWEVPGVSALLNQAGEHASAVPGSMARALFVSKAWLFLTLCLLPGGDHGSGPGLHRVRPVRPAAAGAFAVGSLFLVMTLAHAWPDRAPRAGEILLLRRDGIDVAVPGHESRGLANAGMFGMLPRYLALDGHRVRGADEPITPGMLAGVAVAIAPFPSAGLAARRDAVLEPWMRAGGSLLLVGDHTDILGVMSATNAIAATHGIRLRFDSAYPATREWHGCLDGVGARHRAETGWGTGGSLELIPPARPMLMGRYALSDRGDRANGGRGGFLGDYAWQPGERLGDLALSAWAPVGKGRLVVLGDASPLQNLGLPRSFLSIADLVDTLSRPLSAADRWAGLAAGMLAALLGALCLMGARGAAGFLAASAALGALVPALLSDGGSARRIAGTDEPVALVDTGHFNDLALDLWHEKSIGGLLVNLMRNGYAPIVSSRSRCPAPVPPGALLVLAAPRVAPGTAERRAWIEHVARGGDLLLAASGSDRGAAESLLGHFGVSIEPLPLGPVPIRADMDKPGLMRARLAPQFRQAWPLRIQPGRDAVPRYEAFGETIVAEVASPRGGRVIVIADPEFLTDDVLENEHDAWEGNIRLLADLLAPEAAR